MNFIIRYATAQCFCNNPDSAVIYDFQFFQNFMKTNGILKQLEDLGIQEGDTVRMYGLSFDYYK